MEKNILLTLEYDGSEFHGWQEQEGQRTVQGRLQEALSLVCGKTIKVSGTSRTDTGVHALAQCCSFKADIGIPTDRIVRATNNMLAGGRTGAGSKIGAIKLLSATEKALDFHARFDCKGKKYIYRINDGETNVFLRNYRYFVDKKLDVEAMDRACKHLIGKHDFAAFQAAGGNLRQTTVRTLSAARVFRSAADISDSPVSSEIQFEICGDGFLYNMVRIISGTLVEIGLGRREPNEIKQIISSKNRQCAGHTAPPGGLYLAEIYFNDLYKQE